MKELTDKEVAGLLEARGAIVQGGHFVYTKGDHGPCYLDKHRLFLYSEDNADLCVTLNTKLMQQMDVTRMGSDLSVVVGPEKAGILISSWLAYCLNKNYARKSNETPFMSVFAEKNGDGFELRRGFEKVVMAKGCIVAEDVLNTGGSAAQTVDAVKRAGGYPHTVVAIANRGKLTAKQLGVARLVTLVDLDMDRYAPDDCPLCKSGVPVRTDLGHGREFLAKQKAA